MSMQAETCGGENWTWWGEDVCVCVVTRSVNLCVFGLGGVTSSSAPLRLLRVCFCKNITPDSERDKCVEVCESMCVHCM